MTSDQAIETSVDLIRDATGESREERRLHRTARGAFEALLAVCAGDGRASRVFNEQLRDFVEHVTRGSVTDVLPFELMLVYHLARDQGVAIETEPDLARFLVDLDNTQTIRRPHTPRTRGRAQAASLA